MLHSKRVFLICLVTELISYDISIDFHVFDDSFFRCKFHHAEFPLLKKIVLHHLLENFLLRHLKLTIDCSNASAILLISSKAAFSTAEKVPFSVANLVKLSTTIFSFSVRRTCANGMLPPSHSIS